MPRSFSLRHGIFCAALFGSTRRALRLPANAAGTGQLSSKDYKASFGNQQLHPGPHLLEDKERWIILLIKRILQWRCSYLLLIMQQLLSLDGFFGVIFSVCKKGRKKKLIYVFYIRYAYIGGCA